MCEKNLGELSFAVLIDVFPLHLNVEVPVGATLFVPESKRVCHFMGDNAQLKHIRISRETTKWSDTHSNTFRSQGDELWFAQRVFPYVRGTSVHLII